MKFLRRVKTSTRLGEIRSEETQKKLNMYLENGGMDN
jgi:hypothetical protein